jgi:hypothetical protein
VSVVVGAPGTVEHVVVATSGMNFVDMKGAAAVAVQTPPMFSEIGAPAQPACGKKSTEPPQVAAEIVQAQLAQARVKSAPRRCFVGAAGGQVTSPGVAMHACIDEGAPHAPLLHPDA